ncbi:hypothetical protein AVEN_93977-1 [Araneus ventricosus]|uniref:Uncharacterized protein n=1 Tax=Araneus ventricosus TaxID=182803 RepID=A0A4Y2CKX5_ARAVE|nr:hypothetical protein AVEN_93977-1 [Araneus ventricosus]
MALTLLSDSSARNPHLALSEVPPRSHCVTSWIPLANYDNPSELSLPPTSSQPKHKTIKLTTAVLPPHPSNRPQTYEEFAVWTISVEGTIRWGRRKAGFNRTEGFVIGIIVTRLCTRPICG